MLSITERQPLDVHNTPAYAGGLDPQRVRRLLNTHGVAIHEAAVAADLGVNTVRRFLAGDAAPARTVSQSLGFRRLVAALLDLEAGR